MEALKKMKNNKAVSTDEIPVEAWKALSSKGVNILVELLNSIFMTETIPEEYRLSTLIPIFKNKEDIQECNNYSGINLMPHTMKLWERVIERRIRKEVTFSDEQFRFMPGRRTTDAVFALCQVIEKYREK